MNFKPSRNLSEQAAEYLGERIIRMELKPGDRIVEKKLADELGVSQAPIREALRILEKRKLVELTPRRGAKVADFSPSTIASLYDVIGELLCYAARRCVENGDKYDLMRIDAAFGRVERAVAEKDIPDYIDAIRDFAFSSMIATKNPFLEDMVMDLWPAAIRTQYASLRMGTSDFEKSLTLFRFAREALEKNSPEMAADAIRQLIETEKAGVLRMLRRFEEVSSGRRKEGVCS